MDFLDEIASLAGEPRAAPEPLYPRGREPGRKRDGLFYGKTIYKGRIQFFSVSSLTLGDPESTGGCPRRWWYEKIGGKGRPDQGAANILGEALHEENAAYLKTGDKSKLGPLAAAGVHTLQPPGPDLHVEHEMASGTPGKLVSALTCCGLPVVGKIDLWHRRGTCAGATDVLDTVDPPGTTEVQDHKTTSDLKWALTGAELERTVQMSGYGVWAHNDHGADPLRLSHGYYVTKGRPRAEKRTALVPIDRLMRRWEYVEGVGRVLVDITQETDANRVPFNVKACDFPRRKKVDIAAGIPDGCPHQAYCEGAKQHRLTTLYGPEGDDDMGVLDDMLAADDEPTTPPVDAELRSALEHIRAAGAAKGFGFPTLGGEMAKAQAALSGVTLDSDALAGAGKLAKITITDRAKLMKLAGELGWSAPVGAPPDGATATPAVTAQVAASAVAADPRPAPVLTQPTAEHGASAAYHDAAAAVAAEAQAVADKRDAVVAAAQAEQSAAPAKAPRTRKPKDPPVAPAAAGAVGEPSPQPGFPGKLFLVDCTPLFPATNLRPIVQGWADKAARAASTSTHTVRDIRSNAVDRESACAYGGWRGVFFTIAQAELVALPDGVYYLDTRDGDFAQLCADAILSTPGFAAARGSR